MTMAFIIALLAGGFAWQNRAIVDQADILARRAPTLAYIEESSSQAACVARLQAGYEAALARVVLAAFDNDQAAVAAARPDLAAAFDRLTRIDEICPPVKVPDSQKEPTP
ncbi:MAG: hypothetical protein JWN67_5052 [Actinomycetia bacterium]|nr:hypothetical protein [Actinomycetes bacterium]